MKEWENYFVLTGTAAVTLIGLLFVVITLGVERAQRGDEWLLRTFVTPTLVHFGVVFVIALLALSAEGDSLILPLGLIGAAGLIYSLSIAAKAARSDGLFSDTLLFHGGIPITCYVGIIAVAWPRPTAGLTATSPSPRRCRMSSRPWRSITRPRAARPRSPANAATMRFSPPCRPTACAIERVG